ncbi:MAG TPA: hypothetical protein VHN80_18130 [Kineosporiaceae bacterium]|nr:hypothetical protein [Kineosporiaceae bacterium]
MHGGHGLKKAGPMLAAVIATAIMAGGPVRAERGAVAHSLTTVALRVPATARPSSERVLTNAFTTGYTWFDNTPRGSAQISAPVLHRSAGGTGTYADPITLAVGHSNASGVDVLDFAAGTRFYLPHVRRYFIVEDSCGDGPRPQNTGCHRLTTAPAGAKVWVDLYVGGGPADKATAVQACASTVTDGDAALHRLIVNPHPNHLVVAGALFAHGRCTQLFR